MRRSDLLALVRSPQGKKMLRYSATSVICVVLSASILAVLVGVFYWDAPTANVTTCAITTVPSYVLNRKWAWGKSGRSHLLREIVPFWVMAFIGLALSTVASAAAQSYSNHHHLSHIVHTALVDFAVIGSFGVLWIGKFLIINKYLFANQPEDLAPALETPTGVAR